MKKYTVVYDTEEGFEWSIGAMPREIWYNSEGRIERPFGPAKIIAETDTFEKTIHEAWYKDGVLHREDGPAAITRLDHVPCIIEEWYHRGGRHREDGPAVYDVDPVTGHVIKEEWYKDGREHRVGAPSSVHRNFETGLKYLESWSINGVLHREDGPASISWHEDGTLEYEEWYLHGQKVEPPKNTNIPTLDF